MTKRPIIVIGSGVAGSVVAGTLARECAAPIVVLEAGDSADSLLDSSSRTLSFVDSLARSSTRRDDLLVRRTASQAPKSYPAGRGIGGSGEINALVASWGIARDVEGWGENAPMGIESVEDWKRELGGLEHDLRTAGEGEWGPMDRALVSSCVEGGIARHDSLWNDQFMPEGVGTVTLFARGDHRSTGVDALVKPGIAAGRMRIDRGALVDRLVVRDEMICGVELSTGEFVDARAVVMCAGAFGSVELLQRSGIVPDGVHGVQDHPAVALVTHEPIMQQSVLSIGAIGRLSVDSGVANVHLVSMNATAPGEVSHGALLVALMDVTSRGSIIRHEDGSVSRNLDMLSTQSERHVLVQALRRVVSIVGRMEDRLGTGFQLSEKSESVGWLASASNNEIEEWIMATCGVYAHAASSLPLGGEYLDRHGAVRGVDGVWVADASVMPRLIAGNPTLAIAALAKVIARSVAGATAAS